MGLLQHSPSLLCYPKIHIPDQLGLTMAIYANATQSCTISLAHAMRVRESRGFRALTSYCFAWIPARQTFDQLLYVVCQLYHQCKCRNVSPKSFLLAHMLNLPHQLPQAGPSWHASSQVGLHRHICGYLPSALRQEISSTTPYRSVTAGISRRRKPQEVRDRCVLYT